jgi:small ligand-binding sensory domain FIST
MKSEFAVAGQWRGGWDEAGIRRWVEGLRNRLLAPNVTLGIVFMAPEFFDVASEVLEVLRVHGRIPLLVGCSSTGLIANGEEWLEQGGIVLGLYHLPGASLRPIHFTQSTLDECTVPEDWHALCQVRPSEVNGWLVFADPFHLDGETWLRQWNGAYPRVPSVGGLAGGLWDQRRTQVYLNGDVQEEGVVALAVGGRVRLESVISQGCTPIGETWTITKAEGHFILQIANRPAYSVLVDTFNGLTRDEQSKAQGNLFVGLAGNEYRHEFQRGDFVVRSLLGADPENGMLAIGAQPRAGQTLQFHRRDAAAATEDLSWVLSRMRERLAGRRIYGGCLCCCNGRGERLFGRSNHDSGMVQEQLGPLPVTGCFCAGELGPVGEKNFLHAYTASLALFVES